MPIVPRAKRTQTLNPLPNMRRTAAETPESMGAGVEIATARKYETIAQEFGPRNFLGVASEIRDMVEREQRLANQTVLLEASNKIAAWETDALYNPETGALGKKGKDAFGTPEIVNAEYRTFTDEIAATMSNDEQRLAFAKLQSDRGQAINLQLQRHVSQETLAFRASELAAGTENAVNAAVRGAADLEIVGSQAALGEQQIRTIGPSLGWGPEEVDERVRKMRSSIHVGVINQYLSTGDDRKARAYLDKMGGEIDAEQLDNVTKNVEDGSTRGSAQREADRIIAEGGTLTEQRDKAKKLEDPKVREATLNLIEHENTVKDRVQRETLEQNSKEAANIIDRTGNWRRIPVEMWNSFSPDVRAGLKRYAEQKAEGVAAKTDPGTLYTLITMATANPEEFARLNLMKYRGQLSNADFEQMAWKQGAIRTGDSAKAASVFASEGQQNQIVDEALQTMRLDLTPAQMREQPAVADRINAFRRAVRERVARLEGINAQQGKKGVTVADIQGIVDGLAAQTGSRESGHLWWYENAPTFGFETKEADIPKAMIADIDAALRRAGLPITEANRVDAYNRLKSRQQRGR